MTWDLDVGLSIFFPHLPSQMESLAPDPTLGREEGLEVASPGPAVGTPLALPGACGESGARCSAEVGASVSCTASPWAGPSQVHSHLGGLYLFYSLSSTTSLGKGWARPVE